MKKTMLAYKTLDRFEAEYKTEQYTKAQIEAIELAAYIANMNRSAHRDWTDNDIFADFLRILDIDHIETVPARTAEGITEGITAALNGSRDWSEYSWGGSALVYDGDIAAALCTPSELKKTRNGERRPNSREEWLDVQARALYQAFRRMYAAIRAARQEVQQ